MKTTLPITLVTLDWRDAKTEKPLGDNDCLVIYDTGEGQYVRAPVFWWGERNEWHDEWGHVLRCGKMDSYSRVTIRFVSEFIKYVK